MYLFRVVLRFGAYSFCWWWWGVLILFTACLWSNRTSLKQWMFWVTFWTAQRGPSAKKPRRRRLVSPFYTKKETGIVSGLSKTDSSALVKYSGSVLMHLPSGESLLHSLSKSSAPVLCLHYQWVVFLCALERRAGLYCCPCEHSKGVPFPWVIVLCGPVAGGGLVVCAWQSCGLEHPAGMKHVFFLAWVLSKLNVSSVYAQHVWRWRLILV